MNYSCFWATTFHATIGRSTEFYLLLIMSLHKKIFWTGTFINAKHVPFTIQLLPNYVSNDSDVYRIDLCNFIPLVSYGLITFPFPSIFKCMTHSWYLPCDFHYFIIGLFLCILIKKERKAGLGALLAITLVSMAIPFVLTVVYQRPALLHFYPEFLTGPKVHPDFLLTYCKSHTRATPYFIGMFAGYLYYKLQGKEIHICKVRINILLAK